MGRELRQATVIASLSRHNSDQDKVDDWLWQNYLQRIKLMALEHRYLDIAIEVNG